MKNKNNLNRRGKGEDIGMSHPWSDEFSPNSEKFWEVETNKNGKSKVVFLSEIAKLFLEVNGFRTIKDKSNAQPSYVRLWKNLIVVSSVREIQTFMLDFVYKTTEESVIRRYFFDNLSRIMSSGKLKFLDPINPDDYKCFEPTRQKICFANSMFYISADGLTPSKDEDYVWRSEIIDHNLERIQLIEDMNFEPEKGWRFAFNPKIEDCEFFRFLRNTCNFFSQKSIDAMNEEERNNLSHHLANKISCLGYLMVDYKNPALAKAIIAMDSKRSEFNKRFDCSGKSIIGEALSFFKNWFVIDGWTTKQNQHFFTGVKSGHRLLIIKDVKPDFDFSIFRCAITGAMVINNSHGKIQTIDFDSGPKILVTSNCPVVIREKSTLHRFQFMPFSDYYSEECDPFDDFGHRLFEDWDREQWNLFFNFMIDCVIWYHRLLQPGSWSSGELVSPPPDKIEARVQRQDVGSAFFEWADAFFHSNGPHINSRLIRKEVQEAFFAENQWAVNNISSYYCPLNHKGLCPTS